MHLFIYSCRKINIVIINNNPTYRCEFCGKVYLQKHWCEKHEPNCKANPVNFQKCLSGCVFLESKETKYSYQGISMGENMGVVHEEKEGLKDLTFCTKKKEFIFPFWCGNPILQEDIENETPNEPMPKECTLFSNVY